MTKFKIGDTVWVKGEVDKINGGSITIRSAKDKCETFNIEKKVEVPPFVAEWYEENKMDLEYNLYLYQISMYEETVDKSDFFYWMQKSIKPIKTLINMHQFGYEVIKPQLYTVEIPNPNEIDGTKHVLAKDKNGVVRIAFISFTQLEEVKDFQLTEEEIKRDFEWAWQFAEPVEGE